MAEVLVSGNALSSVAAVFRGMTDEDRAKKEEFDRRVEACRRKRGGHVQARLVLPKAHKKYKATRLYSITTIASLPRYGGTRTVVICDDFKRARTIVEENRGDIFETSYRLAVIEPTMANWLYYHLPEKPYWYRWYGTHATGSYKAIHTPPGYEGVVCFGVG
jgi:hypothetical protein